jgi:hypothetical protein
MKKKTVLPKKVMRKAPAMQGPPPPMQAPAGTPAGTPTGPPQGGPPMMKRGGSTKKKMCGGGKMRKK